MLCKICYRKAYSKSKGSLVPIISIKLFERVQIDLINMQSIPNIIIMVIYKQIAYLIYCMSKIRIFFALPNKATVTITTTINQQICIYSAMDVLQFNNGSEFKEVCLELIKSFSICIINSQLWTPQTQSLMEQANRMVKIYINI